MRVATPRKPGWFEPWGRSATTQDWEDAYTPTPPIPSGYYDPSLDSSRDSASRGLLYTEQDTGLGLRRTQEDYNSAQDDLGYAYQRTNEDLDQQRQYTNEDYTRDVGLLTRRYGQLGRQQGEQARKYGVTSGGIALLSAAKRAENQQLEQNDLDTGRNRTLTGIDVAKSRALQDRDTGLGRAQRTFDRGVADLGTGLSRARSEDLFYGLDVDALRRYQAAQAGYVPPGTTLYDMIRKQRRA